MSNKMSEKTLKLQNILRDKGYSIPIKDIEYIISAEPLISYIILSKTNSENVETRLYKLPDNKFMINYWTIADSVFCGICGTLGHFDEDCSKKPNILKI